MTRPPPLDYETPKPDDRPPRLRHLRTLAAASPHIAIACPILSVALAIAARETLGPNVLVGVLFLTLIATGLLASVVALARARNLPDAVFRFLVGLALYTFCAFILAFYAATHR